ncbi:LytR/AlgR family response regulator transcription factor [Pontibacter beigongshangensis]|uniref:LytR/AlgR family response regulator transcription factor n=1 Tax=Pontibacter beigongshangensis TaxID=2574733 RepID=UPI00164EDAC7|nr:LytTR family DNA-binding domain-containing protein [Pontibacter beigongshangensis]
MPEKISESQLSGKLEVLMHNLSDLKGSSKRIVLPTLNSYTFVNIKDSIRCHAGANYTNIYLANNQNLLIFRALKEFEELLANYNFFKVPNSHLFNIAYIRSYNKGKGGYVTLLDNSEIEVSTRKKADFLQLLTKL